MTICAYRDQLYSARGKIRCADVSYARLRQPLLPRLRRPRVAHGLAFRHGVGLFERAGQGLRHRLLALHFHLAFSHFSLLWTTIGRFVVLLL
jgi:hypothetical protein